MGREMALARERGVDVAPEEAAVEPARRGLPLAVGVCVLVVELAWLAALAFFVWFLVSLF
jgi:hypothetical protein